MKPCSPFAERKILAHLPILGQYLSNGTYPPIQVEIDLTNKCTSNCPWCAGFKDREDRPFILFAEGQTTEEQWESSRVAVNRLVDELGAYGVKSIAWTGGGDPSVHPHLTDIVRNAAMADIDNGLITNGVIDVSECLRYCEWVRFSVDAATNDGYQKQHGREHHFSRVIENIRDAVAKKKRENLEVTIGVGFVTGPGMDDEIIPFVNLWRHIAVDYIQFRPIMSNYGRTYECDQAATLDRVDTARKLDSRVVKSDAKYNAMESGETGMTKRCHGTFLETAIAADGLVYVCCHLKSLPEFAIGNLHSQSFRTIWESHIHAKTFFTVPQCSTFCRHYGTNSFIEDEVLKPRTHENFI